MPLRKRPSTPFAESVIPIWLTVWNAARQHGANGAAAIVGRSPADLPRVYGVVHH
jgi:hypothetical protein